MKDDCLLGKSRARRLFFQGNIKSVWLAYAGRIRSSAGYTAVAPSPNEYEMIEKLGYLPVISLNRSAAPLAKEP
jgi:hypothetical protein